MPTVEKVSAPTPVWPSSLRVSVARLHRRLRTEDSTTSASASAGCRVLALLYREGERTVGQLAAAERVQPPSMTRTVTCLEEERLRRAPRRTPPTAARSSST